MGVRTLLLDTHTFVWAIGAPDRLSIRARQLIESPDSDLRISAASAWEMSTKVRLGRFREAEPLLDQFDWAVDRLGATAAPITTKDALRAGQLRWDHRDPFDRMLAAQAMLSGATLISRDRAFSDLAGLDIMW